MEFTFLNVFEQFRNVGSMLVADLLFAQGTAPRREKFWMRVILGIFLCLAVSLLYFLIRMLPTGYIYAVSFVWWYFLAAMCVGLLIFCYKIGLANALGRGALGGVLHNVATVLVRYVVVGIFFPSLPDSQPVLYAAVAVAIYAAVYVISYFFLIRRFVEDDVLDVPESKRQVAIQILTFTALYVIWEAISGIFYLVEPEGGEVLADTEVLLVRILCVVLHLMIFVVVFVLQYNMYRTGRMKKEKELSDQIIEERRRQYRLSQQAAETIRRQSHDLKHQVNALLTVSEAMSLS